MPVIVSLDIYSGVPNPTWELTEKQVAALSELLRLERAPTNLRSPASFGRLGYRGFEVYTVGELNLPQSARVFDGIIDIGDRLAAGYVDAGNKLEKFLLETAGIALTPEERHDVVTAMEKNARGGIAGSLKDFEMLVVPPYDPGKWNNDPNIRTRNNCYNYANDKITNTFAQPGRGSGSTFSAFDCGSVGPASERDGQRPVGSPSSTPAEGHFIALVIWPGRDFHWYRLDSNTKWSHKPGQTPAKNTDDSGNMITDPRTCDRGNYTAFCGFYHSIPAQTVIR